MHRQRGFSLIEILIVIALILAIAAIAVPSLLRSKASAKEASTVASMRAVQTAQVAYSITYSDQGFANNLVKLGPPKLGTPADSDHAGLLDWISGCSDQPCEKSGYLFAIDTPAGTPVSAYQVTAAPKNKGEGSTRTYCMDQDGVMTFDPAGGQKCGVPLEHDPLNQSVVGQNKPSSE